MLTNLQNLTLPQISQLNGVKDLPLKVRGTFAQAIKAEANGDHVKAQERLDEAIKRAAA